MKDQTNEVLTTGSSPSTDSVPVEQVTYAPAWKAMFFAWFVLADLGFVAAQWRADGTLLKLNGTWLQHLVFNFLVLSPFYLLAFALGLGASGVIALLTGRTGKEHRKGTWYRALILSVFPAGFLLLL